MSSGEIDFVRYGKLMSRGETGCLRFNSAGRPVVAMLGEMPSTAGEGVMGGELNDAVEREVEGE